ncbi:MAG TPA: hypothetical protein VK203_11855 [Nostocaceae cyanobacterium]|nr:hypothetical protein [Nostocaceae cyanobacterium]
MPQNAQKAKGTKLYIALLPPGINDKPVDQKLTILSATQGLEIARDATVIPLEEPITGKIPKGQWLLFKHPENGIERLVQLSEDALPNDEELAVFRISEVIPDGAVAEFPVKVQSRTSASVSRSAALQSTTTFDSGSERDGTTTTRERNLSAPGNYLYYDAGLRTAEYAYENDLLIWVRRELPPPNDAYITGKVTQGPCGITSLPDEVAADGFILQNFEVAFLGQCFESQPKPKPAPAPPPP